MTGFSHRLNLALPRRRALLRYGGALLALVMLASGAPHPAPPAHAAADGVLARIEADGVIRAGTRASAPPFARKLEAGGFEGFSVDLLELVRAAAEEKVGRPVALELHEQARALDEHLTALGKEHSFTYYAGAGHGFFCDDRASHNAEAAADAWAKTLAFFGERLR